LNFRRRASLIPAMSDQSTALLIGPISPAASGPLYQQIVDGFTRAISEGRLTPGAGLPSFRALAEELMVSLITVIRAYEELEREGIIYRRQGLGTFVADRGDEASRDAKLKSARELIRKAARDATEAGLSPAEIQKLARKAIDEETQES
jgi:GntR family transcriptional regulator